MVRSLTSQSRALWPNGHGVNSSPDRPRRPRKKGVETEREAGGPENVATVARILRVAATGLERPLHRRIAALAALLVLGDAHIVERHQAFLRGAQHAVRGTRLACNASGSA